LFYTPNYSFVEINLGIVNGELGQKASAEQHFARALQLQPDTTAHFYYGRWLVKDGRIDEAIPHLKAAAELGPADLEPRHLLLRAYADAGRYQELKLLTQEILRIAPEDLEVRQYVNERGEVVARQKPASLPAAQTPAAGMLNISMQQAQAGRYKECFETASQAARLDPGLAAAFNNMGYCAWQLQRWDEAIRNTQEAIRLSPNFQLAKNNLAAIQAEQRKAQAPGGR